MGFTINIHHHFTGFLMGRVAPSTRAVTVSCRLRGINTLQFLVILIGTTVIYIYIHISYNIK
jgi:hypothetical protein